MAVKKTLFPVYELDQESDVFLTIDGRLGMILEFQDELSLRVAFRTVVASCPYLHVQAQEFFGRYLLSLSKYVISPAAGFRGALARPSEDTAKRSFLDSHRLLRQVSSWFEDATALPTYPEFTDFSQRLFKLKYCINWPDDEAAFSKRPGFCLVKVPNDRGVRVLYYNRNSLEDMLLNRILCIEFVSAFKERALSFWLPLGSFKYLMKLFKL